MIITTSEEKCKLFRAMATNVRCYLENNLVPGITKETVEAALKVKYGADGRQEFVGRQLSGWYLQQLLL